MKAKFIVTIEGEWLFNGKTATAAMTEKELREAVRERFLFLAETKVQRHNGADNKQEN